jgi:hypothetical protein
MYQTAIAKLLLAKDIDDFRFDGTPIYETLVRDLRGHTSRATASRKQTPGGGEMVNSPIRLPGACTS